MLPDVWGAARGADHQFIMPRWLIDKELVEGHCVFGTGVSCWFTFLLSPALLERRGQDRPREVSRGPGYYPCFICSHNSIRQL